MLGDGQAGDARSAQVDQCDVGLMALDRVERSLSVDGDRDDFDPRLAEKRAQEPGAVGRLSSA